jgi:hypothetical protein
MKRKPLDLPPAATEAFMKDMRAYFAEEDAVKRDAIATRQRHALSEFQNSREIFGGEANVNSAEQ